MDATIPPSSTPATRSRGSRRSTTSCGARSPPSESSSTPTDRGTDAVDPIPEAPAADEAWRAWIPGFDRWAATYDDEVGDPWFAYESAWTFVERMLRAGLGDLRGRRVADIGCGTGEFLRRCVGLGAAGFGVEPSPGMRDAASSKVPDATVLDGHLAAIPLGDGAVDAAIATYVVSHLSGAEQPAAIDELIRVVAGDGPIVVVDVPAAQPADMPRVRDALTAAGRIEQLVWYERGFGLDAMAWERRFETTGRRVVREPLGPLLIGMAGLPTTAACG